MIFGRVKYSGKSEFSHFCQFCTPPFQKYKKIPLKLVTFKEKSPNFLEPIFIPHNQSHGNVHWSNYLQAKKFIDLQCNGMYLIYYAVGICTQSL